MNLKSIILFFLLISILLVGCTESNINEVTDNLEKSELNLQHYLDKSINIDEYTIIQSGYDSGFAGVENTGESSYEITFNVINENIIDSNEQEHDLYTITELKNKVRSLNFDKTPIELENDVVCFFQKQMGTSLAIVCFKDNAPNYFIQQEYKGNHQSNEIIWRIDGFQLNEYAECENSRNPFCNIIHNAYFKDSAICDEILIGKDTCMKIESLTPIETYIIDSQKVDCVGVGPMKCMVVNGKYFYDSIEGFEYESGYKYEIKVKKEEKSEPIPADSSKYTYKLIEIISKEAVIPMNCESWFDGCNTCTADNGQLGACTRKFCVQEIMEEPECLAFK